MSTSKTLEQEQIHEVEPHIRVARARAGVLMLILSDALSVVAILAAGGYLSSLNVENQFFLPGDHGLAFLPSLLVIIILALSGIAYYGWERRARGNEGTSPRAFFLLALVFMVVALVVQIWVSITLKFASGAPFHAYESLMMLLAWFTAAHLLLTVIIGLLLLGRVMRNRVQGYIAEATGYWWYYTAIASLIMWLFGLAVR
jgi:hypothetical protein